MERRVFLEWGGRILAASVVQGAGGRKTVRAQSREAEIGGRARPAGAVTLFLAGDVMTGRGVDQIMTHSVPPVLREPYVKSADVYVKLAEKASEPIPDNVAPEYIWGDALEELAEIRPDARIINLETAITTSDDWWPDKQIHYRMHPANVDVLCALPADVCILGNNHVMDFGYAGLHETVAVLRQAGLRTAGAGPNADVAAAPAVIEGAFGRLLVFSYASPTAGVPIAWSAGAGRPGVNVLADLGPRSVHSVIENIERHRRPGDRVVVSLHWGSNWGYGVSRSHREFGHRLVDAGVADLIHGHSSHHPKSIEVYKGRPILYGCGDLLNDYEGIRGKEKYRSDLVLMYFPRLDKEGSLASLHMAPMRTHRFRLVRATKEEAGWLTTTLDRQCRRFRSRVELVSEARLALHWD